MGTKNSHSFGPGNQAARGNRWRKPFSEAVAQLWETQPGKVPEGWPENRDDWTNAQDLAEKYFMNARASALRGEHTITQFLVNRAEGKDPIAPEDRDAGLDAGRNLLAGLSALQALQMALHLPQIPVDTEEATDTPALPEVPPDNV